MKINPKTLLVSILLMTMSFFSYSQGQANWWFFGSNAGLSFTSGSPVAVTTGQISTMEGVASISDLSGNLLFYTDGVLVYDKTHTQMPNGFGLLGSSSTTQSAIIVPKPGSNTLFYIFTSDDFGGPDGLQYSVVDITLNGNLGDVTTKNTFLYAPNTEKITAVMHCNRKDIWVISHDWNSNQFRAYLVSAAGVSAAPVLTSVGSVNTGPTNRTLGYLKSSPNGSKLAYATFTADFVELVDFNNATGVVSNPITFTGAIHSCGYGVEFSPDGKILYIQTGGCSTLAFNIVQINLCAGSAAAIIASSTVLVSYPELGSALQLGPDNKIYHARSGGSVSWLGVINNPNVWGVGANYINNGVPLAGNFCQAGLPNFIATYLKPKLVFTNAINCLTVNFTSPTVNTSNCSGSSNAVISQSWNFGDPASGGSNNSTASAPNHTFTSGGTFNVVLILNYNCGSDTIRQNITISPAISVTTTPTYVSCSGGNNGSILATPANGTSPFTYSWSSGASGQTTQTVTGLAAGNYTVTVTDAGGCTAETFVSIMEPLPVLGQFVKGTANCVGCGCKEWIMITATGGIKPYNFLWPNGYVGRSQNNLCPGTYTINITDINGCSLYVNLTSP